MTTVGVVIPFFQREAGILGRAIRSVLGQQVGSDTRFLILVVDDGSPISAASEMAGIAIPAPHEVEVITQANAGPGAARNTALEALAGRDVAYVAFLDSDDEWMPCHIASALEALGGANDLFFCNHTQPGNELDRFAEGSPALEAWRARALPGSAGTLVVPGIVAFNILMTDCPCHTSTVVYKFDGRQRIRFDADLRGAGEDHMFWIDLARSSRGVAMSSDINVRMGRGVNIFFSAFAWDNPRTIDRFGYLLLFTRKLLARTKLSTFGMLVEEPARRAVLARARECERLYGWLILRNLLRLQLPSIQVLRHVLRAVPGFTMRLPWHCFVMLLNRRRAAG